MMKFSVTIGDKVYSFEYKMLSLHVAKKIICACNHAYMHHVSIASTQYKMQQDSDRLRFIAACQSVHDNLHHDDISMSSVLRNECIEKLVA